jgi:UDP-N-acetylglucosamine transferase subunit ALG13
MILVIMGMEVHPFDRLARAIDELAAGGAFEEGFFIQLGACTYEPQHARWDRYLSFEDLCDKIGASSAVITHAGAGSTLTCIEQGKFPIMVPRRAQDGEHVDDHQFPFTEKMCDIRYATAVREMSELPAAILSVQGRTAEANALSKSSELTDWLEGFWTDLASRAK